MTPDRLTQQRLAAHPFASRPVPRRAADGLLAHAVPFDAGDPRGAEPLVEARARGLAGENYYAVRDGGNPPYCQPVAGAVEALALRAGVVERLVRIEAGLAPYGLGLWLFDGWRPLATQRGLWTFFAVRIARDNPAWRTAEVDRRVATFVADPRWFDRTDPATWPPHSTGGAVDLTLRDRATGARLDLGAGFDEESDMSATGWYEAVHAAGRLAAADPRLLARRILFHAMVAEGFTNYPAEFWHYDLGTRLWAAVRRATGDAQAAAFYATVESL